MTVTAVEAIGSIVGALLGAGGLWTAVRAGASAAFRVAVTDPIKAANERADEAEAERDRARAERDARVAEAERERDAARAEREAFKADWKQATADFRALRRRYERALGMPVSTPAPADPDARATLVGYELRRDDAAFLARLAEQDERREIPTRTETPRPRRYSHDEEKTPRVTPPRFARVMIDDAGRATDPSEPRRPPRRRG